MTTIDETIAPFQINDLGDCVSLTLSDVGTYKQHVFEERAEDGIEGNGYDWESLAQVFIDERFPQAGEAIEMDSEAGMLCLYLPDQRALEEFAVAFHAFCENEPEMRDLLSRAEVG